MSHHAKPDDATIATIAEPWRAYPAAGRAEIAARATGLLGREVTEARARHWKPEPGPEPEGDPGEGRPGLPADRSRQAGSEDLDRGAVPDEAEVSRRWAVVRALKQSYYPGPVPLDELDRALEDLERVDLEREAECC